MWGGRGVGAPTSVDPLREMSLFHDFKLKRRKVDSRCSTEGKRVSNNSLNTLNLDPDPGLDPGLCYQF